MAVEIKHSTGDRAGRFFIEGTGGELGYLDYTLDGRTLTIEHTVVYDELKGTGAARQLVDEAVQFAKDQRYELASNCPYASHVIDKHSA